MPTRTSPGVLRTTIRGLATTARGHARSGGRGRRRSAGRERGFSFVEMVLVMLMLAVLTTIAATAWKSHRAKVEVQKAMADIGRVEVAIASFALDERRVPDTLDELGPEFTTLRDPWGQPYQYAARSAVRGRLEAAEIHRRAAGGNVDYDLYSLGRDGASGTEDTARDDIIRAANGRFIGLATDFRP